MIEALDVFGISLDIEFDKFFQMMDQNRNGELSLEEFSRSLMRLRGSSNNLHAMLVQYDFFCGQNTVVDDIQELEVDCARTMEMEKDKLMRAVQEERRNLQSATLAIERGSDPHTGSDTAEAAPKAIDVL